MRLSLRLRILVAFVPLVVFLAAAGVAGLTQLTRTANRIDEILKENYASVKAMVELNDALERIESSFQIARLGHEDDARKAYDQAWPRFNEQFEIEEHNITIFPREQELVDQLRTLRKEYRTQGEKFFKAPNGSPDREAAFLGSAEGPGLRKLFEEIKNVSGEILRINQENMESARDEARKTARTALIGFCFSLAGLMIPVVGIAWYLLRAILRPIREVTEAAQAIAGSGQLDREVPIFSRDELGQLAEAFNAMTRQLREYRRSNLNRMMRAQKTAQATIDSFPDPILVIEPQGKVELANPAAARLLGVAPSPDAESSPVWSPPESLRQPLQDALQLQRAHDSSSFDEAVTFRFGDEDRTYLPQLRPIRDADGDTLGAAVVLNDVTRFRLLDQFKSDLVATVSHELKTPLTSVRLAIHVLLEEAVGPLNPKQTELLLDARENSERLLSMIEQLLSLARLEQPRGQPVLQPEDPVSLLRHAADSVRPRAEDKHLELIIKDAEVLPPVSVDTEQIGVALGNLLENAVTYTPTGGTITLSATLATDGHVLLTIADSGVGIPREYLPHVFERFFRVPRPGGQTGTGLGLAIVKEIVTAHRGEVSCESDTGKGTVFRIILPPWTGKEGGSDVH